MPHSPMRNRQSKAPNAKGPSIPRLDVATATLLPLLCEAVSPVHHRSKQLSSFFGFDFAPLGLVRLSPPLNPTKAQPAPRPARCRSRDQERSHDGGFDYSEVSK
ncbi:hypothetical protein DHEL01_v202842 [Diaporthe helianthi]|uniref:Uncharacterized protein n=1 Tax=Diaporthe helianthi TaxID=158607 RepID=A0A2P5I8H0_DIAHE|nr:hypothetical protein DHEL01_v202842 [Diaporthe helianthi]